LHGSPGPPPGNPWNYLRAKRKKVWKSGIDGTVAAKRAKKENAEEKKASLLRKPTDSEMRGGKEKASACSVPE